MKAQLCSTSEILGLHYSQEGFKEPKSIWLPHDLVFEVSLENLHNDKVAFYKLKLRMFGSKISWQIHGKDLTSNIKHVPWVKKKTHHDWNSGWCLHAIFSICFVLVLPGDQWLEDTHVDGKTTKSHLLDLFYESFTRKRNNLKTIYAFTQRNGNYDPRGAK